MENDSHLESLMSKLSENLTALQSTYSEFTSTYNSSFDRNPKIHLDLTEKYQDIQNFILNLKESLFPNIELLHKAKNSLIKIKLKLHEIPHSSASEAISKLLAEASKHFSNLEHSHITSIDTRLDELQDMIINKRNFDLVYLKQLENTFLGRSSKTDSSRNLNFNSKPCPNCEKITKEYELIIKKMSVLMERIVKQVKVFQNNGEKINQTASQGQIKSYSTNRKKLTPRPEDHQRTSEKFKRKLEISFGFEEITEWKEKAEKNKLVMKQQEENIKKLVKIIEDDNEGKKTMYENFNKLKEQLEKKINDRDLELKRLEEENFNQIQISKNKLSKISVLEKENRQLHKEIERLAADYEEVLDSFQEFGSKYQKKNGSEKKNIKSNPLSIKNEEISCLKNEVFRKEQKILEKDKEIEDMRSSLKTAQRNLEENKTNLTNLILEYDVLKNTSVRKEKSKAFSINSLETKVKELEDLNKDLQAKLQNIQKILTEKENLLKTLEASSGNFSGGSDKGSNNGYLLSQVIFYETLLSKLQTSPPCSTIGLKVLTRQKSAPALSTVEYKSIDVLKNLLRIDSMKPSLVTSIGLELYEEDPEKFADCISELKKDRDSYLTVVEKYADIINELKEALGEENEYNLLLCVDELKRKVINNNSIN